MHCAWDWMTVRDGLGWSPGSGDSVDTIARIPPYGCWACKLLHRVTIYLDCITASMLKQLLLVFFFAEYLCSPHEWNQQEPFVIRRPGSDRSAARSSCYPPFRGQVCSCPLLLFRLSMFGACINASEALYLSMVPKPPGYPASPWSESLLNPWRIRCHLKIHNPQKVQQFFAGFASPTKQVPFFGIFLDYGAT